MIGFAGYFQFCAQKRVILTAARQRVEESVSQLHEVIVFGSHCSFFRDSDTHVSFPKEM
jgi:hypothetical protein